MSFDDKYQEAAAKMIHAAIEAGLDKSETCTALVYALACILSAHNGDRETLLGETFKQVRFQLNCIDHLKAEAS